MQDKKGEEKENMIGNTNSERAIKTKGRKEKEEGDRMKEEEGEEKKNRSGNERR